MRKRIAIRLLTSLLLATAIVTATCTPPPYFCDNTAQ